MKNKPSNKPLHEMTAEELGQLFPVVIEDYSFGKTNKSLSDLPAKPHLGG